MIFFVLFSMSRLCSQMSAGQHVKLVQTVNTELQYGYCIYFYKQKCCIAVFLFPGKRPDSVYHCISVRCNGTQNCWNESILCACASLSQKSLWDLHSCTLSIHPNYRQLRPMRTATTCWRTYIWYTQTYSRTAFVHTLHNTLGFLFFI